MRSFWVSYLAAVGLLSMGHAPVFADAPAEPPALVKQVAPLYPRGAQRRGLEGHVVTALTIDERGRVTAAEVVEASPPGVFDAAALKAVKQWRFEKDKPYDRLEVALAFAL